LEEELEFAELRRWTKGDARKHEPPTVSLLEVGAKIRELAAHADWWPAVARRLASRFRTPGPARRLLIAIGEETKDRLAQAEEFRPGGRRAIELEPWETRSEEFEDRLTGISELTLPDIGWQVRPEDALRLESSREVLVLSYIAYWTPGEPTLGLGRLIVRDEVTLSQLPFRRGRGATSLARLVGYLLDRELVDLAQRAPSKPSVAEAASKKSISERWQALSETTQRAVRVLVNQGMLDEDNTMTAAIICEHLPGVENPESMPKILRPARDAGFVIALRGRGNGWYSLPDALHVIQGAPDPHTG
jgi:hypothetical protein